ncbi:tetratricopeptide repeat protein [Wenzhouxiangella sp. EGI_FJ10305]|uniref:tetratricopeptide repeat protein n=1 Tax=Wenzhouxiangella sp. EGI_FJ10305 TaxID=3243768 RepID=UPI0035D8BB5D
MNDYLRFTLALIPFLLLAGCSPSGDPPAVETEESTSYLPELAPVGATMLDGLGDYSLPIGASDPEVQRWFDQGLSLTYGFNHQAAERSFLQAAELDPQCAMCWWGAALVLGPHVNAGMNPANNAAAWERLQAAQATATDAPEWQQAYIEALSARYAENPPEDRSGLDQAYADAMAELVAARPDDLDAATLYAESLMNLQPWDYWTMDGEPVGRIDEIVSVLEGIIERDSEHAGALHLYIHAVEASEQPERGVAAADRLRDLIPGSGHLVHMPAHIYARVGRYHDAVLANQLAIDADNAYLAACRPGPGVYPLGYVPHNHHFLWFAASMEGAREIALAAAAETHARTSDPDMMRAPGFDGMQNFALTPLFAKVRFGLWDDIVDEPKPADDLPYMQAMWHYAQGMAAVRNDRIDDARTHHEVLVQASTDPEIEKLFMWERYSLVRGVRVAERVLAAELAHAGGDLESALAALEAARDIEDDLPYDEPPGWHAPVRHTLGAVLLEAGRPEEAEAAYRAELRRNPENGWSLYGLAEALRAQGKETEAEEVTARFEKAWAQADVTLASSRF